MGSSCVLYLGSHVSQTFTETRLSWLRILIDFPSPYRRIPPNRWQSLPSTSSPIHSVIILLGDITIHSPVSAILEVNDVIGEHYWPYSCDCHKKWIRGDFCPNSNSLQIWFLVFTEIINLSLIIIFNELEGTRRRGRPRKRWKEEVERDLQVLGVRRWRELVADRKKNGRTLFDRPKPTVGCSANGRRRIIFNICYKFGYLQQNIVCTYWPSLWRSLTCYLRNVLYMTYEHCWSLPVGLTWLNGPTARLRNRAVDGWGSLVPNDRIFQQADKQTFRHNAKKYHSYSNYEV